MMQARLRGREEELLAKQGGAQQLEEELAREEQKLEEIRSTCTAVLARLNEGSDEREERFEVSTRILG